jgi:hypothetical protein
MLAFFLMPAYAAIPKRPYWARVGDHYFFVLYSFVVMGSITVFEWDLLFPDLLDVYVLTTLPISNRRLFLARILALAAFLGLFLVGANILATLFLPTISDYPNIFRHLGAHFVAVMASGLFAAAMLLSLQGILLNVLGARLFKKLSAILQGLSIMTLLIILFLYPLISRYLAPLLTSGSAAVRDFPPFWFLGLYESLLSGSSALPIFHQLAQTGFWATLLVLGAAIVTYPLAYRRQTKRVIEGAATRHARNWFSIPFQRILHAMVIRVPMQRAVYHFISQTLLRVQRYRVCLAMYFGLGLSLVVSSIVAFNLGQNHIRIVLSTHGLRSAIPILAFWAVAGLRTAFASPMDQRGSWIFRAIRGRPNGAQLSATRIWVFSRALLLAIGAVAIIRLLDSTHLGNAQATVAQLVVAAGLSLLLTDILFLKVLTIPFTGSGVSAKSNLAFILLQYLALFPPLVWMTVDAEPWMERTKVHLAFIVLLIAAAHWGMRVAQQSIVREQEEMLEMDEEEEFPQRLGLA